MNSLQKRTDEHENHDVRKPYASPQVQIYGDLKKLTQGAGAAMGDHGAPGKTV